MNDLNPFKTVVIMFLIGAIGGAVVLIVVSWAFLDNMTTEPVEYVSFQDRHSMDWDDTEENYLIQLATYKGGSVGDRVYNILVALNRVWDTSGEYPGTIEDVCELELPCGMPPEYTAEEWRLSEEAMKLILYERYDNSGGSLEYREGN